MAWIRHTDEPGSPAWHARRARCFNAGDASAMLGCHPSGKTRTQLLQELHTGVERQFSDFVQERVIDPGHRVEALWRPIAQEILGDDLQVLAGSLDVGLSRPLGASLDGITFLEDVLGECKSANEALRAALPHSGRDSHTSNDARQLPKGYRVQMEQQQLVTGATRTLFSACLFDSDGVPTEERHCWYESDPQLRAEILAGWKQFDADLAGYVPSEVKEMPKADVSIALPALVIHAKGEITTSNMKEYGAALAKRLAEVRSIALVTDVDFSNAKAGAKLLREEIQKAKLVKAAMLEQTLTVGEAARMIDAWCEDMRVTALQLEQDVEREDRAKKAAMIAKAKAEYEAHIEALKADTGGPWIALVPPNWPEAIKSKRNFASMQDALDTMLANAKIAADESARKIRAALACMAEEGKGYEFLLADRLAHIGKPVEDVRTLVRARITEHRAAEERRAAELAERERARIRAEEEERASRRAQVQARIDAIATAGAGVTESALIAGAIRTLQSCQLTEDLLDDRVKEAALARVKRLEELEHAHADALEREQAAARAEQERQRQQDDAYLAGAEEREQQRQAEMAGAVLAGRQKSEAQPAAGPAVIPMPTRAPAAAPGARITLGEINKRIAPLSIDAAGLRSLAFEPTVQGSAKTYDEGDFPQMVEALRGVLAAAIRKQLEAA